MKKAARFKRFILGAVAIMLCIMMSVSTCVFAAEAKPGTKSGDTVTRAEWLSKLTEIFEMTVEDDNYPDNYFSDLDSESEYYYDMLLTSLIRNFNCFQFDITICF